jgi:hypothetical protein
MIVRIMADIGQAQAVIGEPDLPLFREFRDTIELAEQEEIASGPAQDLVESAVEMQQRDQGDKVGDRFVIGEIVVGEAGAGQPDRVQEHGMPGLMGEHVEIEGKRQRTTIRPAGFAELQKTETGLRIVPGQPRHDLEAVVGRGEEPRQAPAQIALADVLDAPYAGEGMGGQELPGARRQVVEVPVGPGLSGCATEAGIRRQVGKVVGILALNRVDHVGARIGRARSNPVGRARHPDHFRNFIARDKVRLWEHQEARAKARGLGLFCANRESVHDFPTTRGRFSDAPTKLRRCHELTWP